MSNHDGNQTATWVQDLSGGGAAWLDVLVRLLVLVVIVVGTYYAGQGLRVLAKKLRRRPPTAGGLLAAKVSRITAVMVAAGLGLTLLFGVDVLSLFATLGIVSLALGFGLQNTVANLAAGVGLSLDRPFQVGDRIRVGTTWGDVMSIGLRSTRILTTSGEQVAIPNAVLDTQEVWNNTHGKDVELRIEMPFSITYDSSVQLAESIALRAARRNDHVLAYPEPKVQVKAMGAHGIEMELRAWIDQARIRAAVEDRLYRELLRDFHNEGIIVPFPHQVHLEAKDIPKPAPTPEFLRESETEPLVLIATRGSSAAQELAPAVLGFVKKLEARAIVLHVRTPAQRYQQLDADKAINAYMSRARQLGVNVHARAMVGELAASVAQVAREEGVRLVILGQSLVRGRAGGWPKHEVAAVARGTHVPVLPLQTHLQHSAEFIERWHQRLRPSIEDDDDDD